MGDHAEVHIVPSASADGEAARHACVHSRSSNAGISFLYLESERRTVYTVAAAPWHLEEATTSLLTGTRHIIHVHHSDKALMYMGVSLECSKELFSTAEDNSRLCEHGNGKCVGICDLPNGEVRAVAFQTRAKMLFLRCGMPESAWQDWGKMHVSPLVAIAHFYIFQILLHAIEIYMVTGMHLDNSIYFWGVTLPYILHAALSVVADGYGWIYGPSFVHRKIYPPLFFLTVVSSLPLYYVAYLGPESAVPWNNRFYFACVHVVCIWFATQTMVAGKVKGMHPAEPRTSILGPAVQATMSTMLLWDAITDITVLKSLVEQARSQICLFCANTRPIRPKRIRWFGLAIQDTIGNFCAAGITGSMERVFGLQIDNGCWWFGTEGRCSAWIWLSATFGVCAFLDFASVKGLELLGFKNGANSKRIQRYRPSML